jgi:AraC-like DNA-binding protein
LLRRGRSVTDAAFSAGFSDLSRFARMFERRFGMLPSGYAGGSPSPHSSTAAKSSPSIAPSALVS